MDGWKTTMGITSQRNTLVLPQGRRGTSTSSSPHPSRVERALLSPCQH